MRCTKNGKRSLVVTGSLLIIVGASLLGCWSTILATILKHELILTNTSTSFKLWREPPIPIYLSVYLFNWTNAKEVINSKWNIKPELIECGPYVFSQHHVRVNVTWNDNNTVTYQQKRIWKFIPSMSNGSLSDNITNVNLVTAVVGHRFEDFPQFLQYAVDKLLYHFDEKLYITKSVRELLFDGYTDPILTDIAAVAHYFDISFNFDRMGWFYSRNDSAAYEGTFTIYTGMNSIDLLGMMHLWNGLPTTDAYSGLCSVINGSSGELYPPVRSERVSIFLADICSTLTLEHQGSEMVNGIMGERFIGTDYNFDNGSKYPEQACFVNDAKLSSGVRNIGKCKFDAPAFLSNPHFYLADSSYAESVRGLHANKTIHEMNAVFEPNTGFPLTANVMLQANIFLNNIPGLSLFKDVKPTYIPSMWFKESATIPEDYSSTIKLLLVAIHGGRYFMCSVICIGVLLGILGLYLMYSSERETTVTKFEQFQNE